MIHTYHVRSYAFVNQPIQENFPDLRFPPEDSAFCFLQGGYFIFNTPQLASKVFQLLLQLYIHVTVTQSEIKLFAAVPESRAWRGAAKI